MRLIHVPSTISGGSLRAVARLGGKKLHIKVPKSLEERVFDSVLKNNLSSATRSRAMEAGSAMAAVQLVATIWTGCLGGYKLITKAKNLGRDSQTLLWKFRIQETRLRMWGVEWGLSDRVPVSATALGRAQAQNHQVLETLLRISELLRDYNKLTSRYGLVLVMDDAAPTNDTVRDMSPEFVGTPLDVHTVIAR